MFYKKWQALGTTVAIAAMLLGCGGGSESSDPEPHLLSASESAPAAYAVATTAERANSAPSTPFTPPIATVAAIRIPPLPAIAAISVPAISSVATIPPSSPLLAATSTRLNKASRNGSVTSDEFSGKKMVGFTNVGLTCYANAAIKLLIHSVGPSALISHLENISNNIPTEQTKPFKEFINLIRTAHTETESNRQVLHDFFTTLEETELFIAGKIIGQEEGTSYFLTVMNQLFQIEKIDNGGLSLVKESKLSTDHKKMQQESVILHMLLPQEDNMDLQALVNLHSKMTTASSADQYQFQVEDENSLKIVNFVVNSRIGSKTDQLNFNDTVTIPVVNKFNGKKFTATLQAKSIVFPQGTLSRGMHYVAYLKYDEKGFSLHDDWKVTDGVQIKEDNYPELISFSVVKMEADQ